jgi:hypothetical protein
MGAKVGLVGRAVEQQPHWDEVLGYELLNQPVRIRHGIQRKASRSVLAAKISQDEAPLAVGSRERRGKIGLPGDCDTIHTLAPCRLV